MIPSIVMPLSSEGSIEVLLRTEQDKIVSFKHAAKLNQNLTQVRPLDIAHPKPSVLTRYSLTTSLTAGKVISWSGKG
jgi:hypothetical protein